MGDPFSMAVAGLGSIKTALDITKTLSDARDLSKLIAVKLELQQLLLSAQEAQSSLIEEKRQLTERIRQLEALDGLNCARLLDTPHWALGGIATAGTEAVPYHTADCRFEWVHQRN